MLVTANGTIVNLDLLILGQWVETDGKRRYLLKLLEFPVSLAVYLDDERDIEAVIAHCRARPARTAATPAANGGLHVDAR